MATKKQQEVEAMTAEQLAESVNRSGKVVRAYLRRNFTRPTEAKGSRWMIEGSIVEAVQSHFAAIDNKVAQA